jgi:hypothetical protein
MVKAILVFVDALWAALLILSSTGDLKLLYYTFIMSNPFHSPPGTSRS